MTVSDLRKTVARQIEDSAGDGKFTEASWIVSACTGLSGSFILSHPDYEVPPEAADRAISMASRRKMHEPIQYILGSASFFGRDFAVRPGVLIPRSDTEILVSEAISFIADIKNPKVLDMCTGSGCIAVTVKAECEEADVTASDISEEALNVARINADNNKTHIKFIKSDYFTDINGTFDIIISNPPYITKDEMEQLSEDVKGYEPELALFGGDDGLDAYRIISEEAKPHLSGGGALMFEIGWKQAEDVKKILAKEGFSDVKCIKDLAGRDRVITGILQK